MKTFYSNLTDSYKFSMELTGFARCLEHYMRRLPLRLPSNAKILDVGCGTGNLSIALKKSFPHSAILATDLEEKFFADIRKQITKYNFSSSEFNLGIADINTPESVLLEDKNRISLEPNTFDVVMVGATLGYATDPKNALARLLRLVKAGGYFIDIEMSQNLIGRALSSFFKYKNPGIKDMVKILEEKGFTTQKIPFTTREFSAGLSRTGIVARKNSA